jgi:integrase/recombinase XerD
MSVKLRKRKNNDGTTTLLLDIYHNGERRYEFLKHLKLCKAANPLDRLNNKSNIEQAEKIAVQRAHELQADDYNMITDTGKKTIATEWMQSYVDSYTKKDKRNMQGSLNRFKTFLLEEKKQGLTFGRLNEIIVSDFQDHLQAHCEGEGSSSYFARFKKMIKQAHRHKLIKNNPAADIKTIKGESKKKDILTLQEIQKLSHTPTKNSEVKRAFLYSCFTGLRWIDVSGLRWSNINTENRQMKIQQSKTGKQILINLNNTALKLLGTPGGPDDLVFNLPTANGANKTVKAWVKRAGIEKQITWHNGRHSFGTNLIFEGANVITASNLLGHSTLKHTQRYVTASNELKERATDKLNIDLG